MNTRHLIAAAALTALGAAAIAGPVDVGMTRAEVIAERDASFAQRDAVITRGESYGTVSAASLTSPSRSDRMAEFNDTTMDDDVARGEAYGDVSLANGTVGSAYTYQTSLFRVNDAYGAQAELMTQTVAVPSSSAALTRAEVKADLVNARASGEFDARGEVFGDLGYTKFGNLPQQPVASAQSPSEETVVLMVATDGETLTLQPGEAVMLVPDGE